MRSTLFVDVLDSKEVTFLSHLAISALIHDIFIINLSTSVSTTAAVCVFVCECECEVDTDN